MSTAAHELDIVDKAQGVPALDKGVPNVELDGYGSDSSYDDAPTEEQLRTLRRVSGKVPWTAYTVAFVELCERFSYYGTTAVFVNFLQQDLPPGSKTGAGFSGQSGGLGLGQQTSTGLTTFNQFWCYVTPLLGGYVADEYLGRFRTIQWTIWISIVGHIILIISAIPPVIVHPHSSVACFSIGLIVMGIGTGGFKSNISPFIGEQYKENRMHVKRLEKTGELVIVDPVVTYQRIYNYFYLMINVGSLVGSVSMVYAEKYVGFWLSYLLPTAMFLVSPMVLLAYKNKYTHKPATGSVLGKAVKLIFFAMKGRWSLNPVRLYKNIKSDDFWERVKPSHIAPEQRPKWMTFDDIWVDEVAKGLNACAVFVWYPIYWLSYNQMTNNLTSQAATMELHGVPNDIINNLDPLALIIFIPIVDAWMYPFLRSKGIHFTPIKRITVGFFLGCLAMVWASVTQHYIYKKSACGKYASSCDTVAPLNVWIQTGPYVLIAFSEIFASITGLEYAFTKAPVNMRSFITGIYQFTSAFSAALGEAFTSLATDPLLEWLYGSVAIIAFVGGVGFWFTFRNLDKEEDHMNMTQGGDLLATEHVEGKDPEEGVAKPVSQPYSEKN